MPNYMFEGVQPAPILRNLSKLSDDIAATGERPGKIDAGLSYLGQLVAHDIAGSEARGIERSFYLDLQCLYGSGFSECSHFLDADGCFVLGMTSGSDGVPVTNAARIHADLPRVDGKANIMDARNDENLLISQLHLAFMNVHNFLVLKSAGSIDDVEQRFDTARLNVILCYQWIVVHQFLQQVLDPVVFRYYFSSVASGRLFAPTQDTAPFEFTHAGFRFGHSMIRRRYDINVTESLGLPDIFAAVNTLGPGSAQLATLNVDHVVEWEHLFSFDDYQKEHDVLTADPIDLHMAAGMGNVPDGGAILNRNLTAGAQVGLGTGQVLLAHIAHYHPQLFAKLGFDESELRSDKDILVDSQLETATPLWLYVMAEAQSQRLGKLGSMIVAEVILAGLESSPINIYDPANSVHVADLKAEFTNLRQFTGPSSGNSELKFQDLIYTIDEHTRGRL